MVSVCLPSDALLQHLPSYLGFSYLGRGVSLHDCSSKAQPLLLTLDEGYLLTASLPDLQSGIAPLGPPAPAQPWVLGRGVAPPSHRPWPRAWGHGVAPPGCRPWPPMWGSSSQLFHMCVCVCVYIYIYIHTHICIWCSKFPFNPCFNSIPHIFIFSVFIFI